MTVDTTVEGFTSVLRIKRFQVFSLYLLQARGSLYFFHVSEPLKPITVVCLENSSLDQSEYF